MEGSSYFKSTSITRIINVSHDKILQLNPHFWLRKCPHKKRWNLPASCPISSFITKLWIPQSLFHIISQSCVHIRPFSASLRLRRRFIIIVAAAAASNTIVLPAIFCYHHYIKWLWCHIRDACPAHKVRSMCSSYMYVEHVRRTCVMIVFVIPIRRTCA